jgi:hypothetical protein
MSEFQIRKWDQPLNQENRKLGNGTSGLPALLLSLLENPLFPEEFVIARPQSSGRRGDRSSTCRILIRKKGKQEMR